MKSLIALITITLSDAGVRCGTSTTQDLKTILRRVSHEDLSFLTISLPNFCRDFERSLDQGFVDPSAFAGYAKAGGLPRFLGGFLDLVFDRDSALLLDEPNIDAIQALRQITLMWSKVRIPCSQAREFAAFDKFIECEQDVRESDTLLLSEPNRLERYKRIGGLLWADYLSRVDSRVYNDGVVPKHGPGATADKLRGNAKYNQLTWTSRLEKIFPHWDYLIPSPSFLQRLDDIDILEPGDEIPVKVISVPKTLKTPRIIAIEPTCMQYMQQGILSMMVQEMSGHDNPVHFIQFESQEPNQRLARQGSTDGTLATLDLSEASDRVSMRHVELLLSNTRWLRLAVHATRSSKATVPLKSGPKTVDLEKFASMGSALCFPFEALVFTTVIFCGIEQALSRRLTKRDIKSFFGRVRVYGDDIIVPVEFVHHVVKELEAFGLKVNSSKSFWTGKFRESCGKEYYAGTDVTVARVRTLLPDNKRDVPEIISTVSLRNQMFHLGYDLTVDMLDTLLERLIPFPYVYPSSSLLGRHAYWLPSQETRHDSELHIPLVRGMVITSESPVSQLEDYGALMKWFLNNGDEPLSIDHLERAGRPRSVRIKARWACPW